MCMQQHSEGRACFVTLAPPPLGVQGSALCRAPTLSLTLLLPALRVGDALVVRGDENPECAPGGEMAPQTKVPFQCDGRGQYLTLYRNSPNANISLCEVYVYLAGKWLPAASGA